MLENHSEKAGISLFVSLSNNTSLRLIKNFFNDIKFQVVDQIKTASFSLFAISIDKSTDIVWSS